VRWEARTLREKDGGGQKQASPEVSLAQEKARKVSE